MTAREAAEDGRGLNNTYLVSLFLAPLGSGGLDRLAGLSEPSRQDRRRGGTFSCIW
jgi:hypothetical protein